MGKRLSLPTRSFGSDAQTPDAGALAGWVRARRGRWGDLMSYQLEKGLMDQLDARITSPCTGGNFYLDRVLDSLTGVEARIMTGEVGCDPEPFGKDATDLTRISKDLFLSLPSPLDLGLTDRYYHDEDEAYLSLYTAYRQMMRAMRDGGIAGNVLLCERPRRDELEALAGRKVFFFSFSMTRKSLETLLEYQSTAVVAPSALGLIGDLMGEYEVQKIILLDAKEQDILNALELKDPDGLLGGGYCHDSCSEYWRALVKNASFLR